MLLYIIGSFYWIVPYQNIFRQLYKSGILLCAALLIDFFSETRWQSYILNAFLTAMVITLILSYIKYYYHPAFLLHSRFDKSSVFKDHIIQNFLMVIATFIFIYRFLKQFRFLWIYGFLALATIFNIIFMSQGRSGYFIFTALFLYMSTLSLSRLARIVGSLHSHYSFGQSCLSFLCRISISHSSSCT